MQQGLKENDFQSCAKDAVIILDACSTAKGENSLAKNIAQNNKGKTVLAPGRSLFFSRPLFHQNKQSVTVKDVVHGFAVFNGYTSKKFTVIHEN